MDPAKQDGRVAKQGSETLKGLAGKVAIVTGGGQGIGRAITHRLADEGCKVAIFDINPDAGEETAKLVPNSTIKTYAVDVGDRVSVDRAVAQVEAEVGPIWVLVNNAGWDRPMPFLKTDKDLWDKIIASIFMVPSTHTMPLRRSWSNTVAAASSILRPMLPASARATRPSIRRARAALFPSPNRSLGNSRGRMCC